MTIAYRVLNSSIENRIEFGGQIFGADQLCESMALINLELRRGLPRSEQIEAQHQIAQYEALLAALRGAGA